jgi:hypothetical protein
MGTKSRIKVEDRVRSTDPEDCGAEGTVVASMPDAVRVRWDWSGAECWVPTRHVEAAR